MPVMLGVQPKFGRLGRVAYATDGILSPDEQGVHQWFAEHPREWANGLAYRFSVLLEGQMIGLVDIDGIAGHSGILGYWLEKGSRGRGYASEATSAALGFAFKTVGLRTIRAAHASDNVASGYVLRSLGFQQVDAVQRFSHSRRAEIMQRQYVLTSSL